MFERRPFRNSAFLTFVLRILLEAFTEVSESFSFLVLGPPRCISLPAVSVHRRLVPRMSRVCPLRASVDANLASLPTEQTFYDFAADSPPRNESKRGLLRLRWILDRAWTKRPPERKQKTTAGEWGWIRLGEARRGKPHLRGERATGAEGFARAVATRLCP